MSWFICGAQVVGSGERFATKKALRDAMAADPASVYFDGTAFPVSRPEGYRGTEVPGDGISLQVTGPDPFTSRRWYATVKLNRAGKVVVE